MSVSAIFEFVAENPPTFLIGGGILLIVLSIFTGPFDVSTTEFIRNIALVLIGLGFILQVLWLVLRYR
ncbi:MAG: hypothetical protein PVH73_01030 [Candidatus Bathyarchaeota archaeon]|jgi:hypothetical protein